MRAMLVPRWYEKKEVEVLWEKHQFFVCEKDVVMFIYVSVVSNCSRKELMPIIQGKILEGSEERDS